MGRHATLNYFAIDIEIEKKEKEKGHCHFLNSTRDIGDRTSRAPTLEMPTCFGACRNNTALCPPGPKLPVRVFTEK